MRVKLYLTLCDPMDCSLLCFSIHEIFQAKILEWVAISFSRGSSWPRDWTCLSWHFLRWQEDYLYGNHKRMFGYSRRWNSTNIVFNSVDVFFILKGEVWACMLSYVWLCVTPWIVTCQATLSMRFSRQKYWSRLPFPPPGDLPDPGVEFASSVAPALQVDSIPLSHQGSPILPY